MMQRPAPSGFRWVRMATRIERALEGHGFLEGEREAVLTAHGEAGLFRAGFLPPDEDHPDWLHPGRTLLVLLEDGGVRDPELLKLGAGLDQREPAWIPVDTRQTLVAADFPFFATGFGGEVHPEEEAHWLEAALLLDSGLLTLMVAEGLDLVRHRHLLPPTPVRLRAAQRGVNLLTPLAYRVGGTLERRFRWWTRRVAPTLAGPEFFGSSSTTP
jgi:hypothetical protein